MRLRFKRIFSLIIILSSAFLMLHAQRKPRINVFSIYGKLEIFDGSVEGARITLLRNDEIISDEFASGGRFEYEFDFDYDYVLKFSKRGYITKKVYISTYVPQDVYERDDRFPGLKFDLTLYPQVRGVDYSIFEDPVGMVLYDVSIDDFDFDKEYNLEMEEKIKKVEDQVKTNLTQVDNSDIELTKRYAELIARADRLFDVKSYNDSKNTYKEALSVKPKEQYPKDRIALIDRILADLANREKQKERDEAYFELLKKADQLFIDKKYIPSRSYYQEASAVLPDKQYPKDQIKKIDDILAKFSAQKKAYADAIANGDRFFREEKYPPARSAYEEALQIKEKEQYPKDQIARIDRIMAEKNARDKADREYSEVIATADRLFGEKKYVDAKLYYQEALVIKPQKQYPKDQIALIDQLFAKQKSKDDSYAQAIERADRLFNDEDWVTAKSAYQNALLIKSFEQYPKEQILKIDEILKEIAENLSQEQAYALSIQNADRLFNAEQWADAKSTYFDALKIKPEENYPSGQIDKIDAILADLTAKKAEEDNYNAALNEADRLYDATKWAVAKDAYQNALNIRSYEQYPKDQILRINELTKQIAEKKAEEDRYNELIVRADAYYNDKDYNSAKLAYKNASIQRPRERYPKDKMQIIDFLEKQQEVDAKKMKKINEDYDKAIQLGDQYFETKEWSFAKHYFRKAISLKPYEEYSYKRLYEIQDYFDLKYRTEDNSRYFTLKESREDIKAKYDKYIAKADSLFNMQKLNASKSYYMLALALRYEDIYSTTRLNSIDKALAAKQKQELNEEFSEAIGKGNIALSGRDYGLAKFHYRKAYETGIDNHLVSQKLEAVRQTFVSEKNEKIQEEFSTMLGKAKEAENRKKFGLAKRYYQYAYELKPEADYLLENVKRMYEMLEVPQ